MKKLNDIWKGNAALPEVSDTSKFHAKKAAFHGEAAVFFRKGGLPEQEAFQNTLSDFHNKKSKE